MAEYFRQYSGGYQWVPSNYYQMLTQPTQNIAQGAQGMVSNLAQGYIGMKQRQQAETEKMQQAQGMQMATQPALEIAQRYAQKSGIPMPESLATAAPNISRMSPEQLQGFNQGIANYMQYAQAAEAKRFAATQAAMLGAIGLTPSMPVSQPQVYQQPVSQPQVYQQPAQPAPVAVQRYASPDAYRNTIGTAAGF